jgi:catechol 2,3-dioxygenase-like lactoylglutathione lyase family enzyme
MPGLTLRVARPTDHLAAITAMYTHGLGLSVLAQFFDHDGFDGTILGTREDPYHIEFTTRPGHHAGRAATDEHLLVFYVPDGAEWEARCASMLAAGFRGVSSANPYWDVRGRTFEDPDGYRVVLQNSAWEG